MVYLFLADGFEEIEALTPVDLLRRAEIDVTTVGISGKTVTGAHHVRVEADVTAEEALAMLKSGITPRMVILPGGMPGAANLDISPAVDAFLDAAKRADAFFAAICAAPMILGKRGILNGKKTVCYPGFEKYLQGAEISSSRTVSDGNCITGCAMGAATEFSLALVSALKGDAAAQSLRAAIIV